MGPAGHKAADWGDWALVASAYGKKCLTQSCTHGDERIAKMRNSFLTHTSWSCILLKRFEIGTGLGGKIQVKSWHLVMLCFYNLKETAYRSKRNFRIRKKKIIVKCMPLTIPFHQ